MKESIPLTTLSEIIRNADERKLEALERELATDLRKGVRKALDARRKQLERQAKEAQRINSLYDFDASHGPGVVVGLDEVGRGALAGPLAVGAVVLPAQPHIALLNDSKQLTPQQRESIAKVIEDVARAKAVFYVWPEKIDEVGMSAALRLAFCGALQAIEQQGIQPDVVLIDGNPLHIDNREVNVIKGDAKSACIAAASILAKVTRDAFMVKQDSTYPHYGFSSHKGYGSAEHLEAIRLQGLSPIHRKSFCRSFDQPSLF